MHTFKSQSKSQGVFPSSSLALLVVIVVLALMITGCRRTETPADLSPSPNATLPVTSASSSKKTGRSIRSDIGFATRQKFLDHYGKHGQEFGSISKEEYLRQAQELRDITAGGDILEVVRQDGVITRFDKSSKAFLAFNTDLTIRTYFKPNDGEAYFHRQSKRAAAQSGRSNHE